MTTWIYSDPHYGHSNILLPTYCNRPFRDVEDMTRGLIERHNLVVKKDDLVFCLGDFSLKEAIVPLVLPQLNGVQHLILGNHDKPHPTQYKAKDRPAKVEEAIKRYLDFGFKEVVLQMRFEPFLLCHLPYGGDRKEGKERFPEYRPKDDGGWLLHGHCHSTPDKRLRTRAIDCGVDAWDYYPVQLETLIAIKEAQ